MHLYAENSSNVNLLEMCTDYQTNFHRHTIKIATNIPGREVFRINFSLKNLNHLLGFHKLSSYPANSFDELLSMIFNEQYTYNDIRQDESYKEIRNRFENYYFFNEVFYPRTDEMEKQQILISIKDRPQNRLGKTELIIYKPFDRRRNVIIGFVNAYSDIFVPSTLHVRLNNEFFNSYKATISNKTWIQ